MALPNSGTFSYNGVSFVAMYKSKAEVKPVKDSAGRALVAREYTIEVDGDLAANTTDETLASMRIALEKPGGKLTYTGKGFGPLNVNQSGGVYDAAYGPWPDVLAWEPIGNDQGCRVRWRCTTLLPCEESPKSKGIIEFCWSEDWDIDNDGYTTRTIEGHLTIQATRASVDDRTIQDNADAYREQVIPDLPLNFKREQTYQLSEDKRTLDFHIQDVEIPAALPSGTTACDVVHKARWVLPGTEQKIVLTSSLSGTITLPARTPKKYAWNKIMLIMRSRWPVGSNAGQSNANAEGALRVAAAGIAGNGWGQAPVAGRGSIFLLQNIEIEDEVFGRSVRFSASCIVIPKQTKDGVYGPSLLLKSTGLWAPIPNTTFAAWKKSVFGATGKPYAPRGVAGMAFQNGDDLIIDLCSGTKPAKANSDATGRSLTGSGQVPRQSNGSKIDPENTWMAYQSRIELLEENRVIRHKPLIPQMLIPVSVVPGSLTDDYADSPGLQPPEPGEIGGELSPSPMDKLIGTQGESTTGGAPDLLQEITKPTQTIRLSGGAMRLGYPIPTPRIDSCQGKPLVQLRQKVSQKIIANVGGLAVYAAKWDIDYAAPAGVGGELPMPVNPALE